MLLISLMLEATQHVTLIGLECIYPSTACLQLPRHQEGQVVPVVQRTAERRLAKLWQLLRRRRYLPYVQRQFLAHPLMQSRLRLLQPAGEPSRLEEHLWLSRALVPMAAFELPLWKENFKLKTIIFGQLSLIT